MSFADDPDSWICEDGGRTSPPGCALEAHPAHTATMTTPASTRTSRSWTSSTVRGNRRPAASEAEIFLPGILAGAHASSHELTAHAAVMSGRADERRNLAGDRSVCRA